MQTNIIPFALFIIKNESKINVLLYCLYGTFLLCELKKLAFFKTYNSDIYRQIWLINLNVLLQEQLFICLANNIPQKHLKILPAHVQSTKQT